MLLIPNRYATACQVVDDAYFYEWLGNPFRMPKEQLPAIMFATPSGLPGRGHDALRDLTAVVVEYDSGDVTVDDFRRQHGDLQWFLYTTSSHTPDHHRFRVALPLAEPMPYKEALIQRHRLNTYFSGCDPLSLTNWQACPRHTNHYAWCCNTGDLFAFDRVKQITAPDAMPTRAVQQARYAEQKRGIFGGPKQIRNVTAYADSIWRECLEELWRIPTYSTGGKRRQRFYAVISKLASAQANGQFLFADDEIMQLVMAHSPEQRRAKMVMSACRERGGR